ncbi:MAG: GTP 3',8-cyclase MoaA [Candidatus Omnitrophota bacterium]
MMDRKTNATSFAQPIREKISAEKNIPGRNPRALLDIFGRPLEDLRISLIDRCNFRCPYCMPESGLRTGGRFLPRKEWLTFPEIRRIARLFIRLGVSKIRLTGGEPLLRPHIDELIGELSILPGLRDLALTTNGRLLSRFAPALKKAGLQRLTISLDTLDPVVFRKMTGNRGGVEDILEGIQAAEEAGFLSLKINAVIQRSINDHTILKLVDHFKNTPHVLRFIEYMDAGNSNRWQAQRVVPSAEILAVIRARYPLGALTPRYRGEVASRYQFLDGTGEIGFISSITQPFCGDCTRARLSPDGKLYTCLFAGQGNDLKKLLRRSIRDEKISEHIKNIWKNRMDQYSELRGMLRIMPAGQKIEMFQIGG